jgi:hypothetical protein
MVEILIDAVDRARLENAMRDWADQLPREPGQIGKSITSLVYGQDNDGRLNVQIPREFVPHLAQIQFPFRVG